MLIENEMMDEIEAKLMMGASVKVDVLGNVKWVSEKFWYRNFCMK